MKGYKRFAPLFFLLILILVTRGILIQVGRTQEFSYRNIAISVVDAQAGRLVADPFKFPPGIPDNTYRGGRLVVILLPVFMSVMTGIPVPLLIFLPLMGIMLPLAAYVLCRRLFRSELIAFGFASFLALEPLVSSLTYNLNIEGFGDFFFFLVVLVSLLKRERKLFALTLSLYLSTLWSYYTAELYVLSYVIFVILISRRNLLKSFSAGLAVTMVIFSWLLDSSIDRVLTFSKPELALDYLRTTFQEWIQRLAGESAHTSTLVAVYPQETYFNAALIALIVVPVFVLISRRFDSGHGQRSVLLALFATGVIEGLTYVINHGHAALKYVFLVLPLLSITYSDSLLRRRNLKYLKYVYVLVLLVLAGLKFAWFVSVPWSGSLQNELQSQNDNAWITMHQALVQIPVVYVSDLRTSGKLIMAQAEMGVLNESSVHVYESMNQTAFIYYGGVANLTVIRESMRVAGFAPSYLVVDTMNVNHPFAGNYWADFAPVGNLAGAVNTPTANIVFSSQSTILFWLSPDTSS